MPRTGSINDLTAFVIVAREGSFTRAAARLGVSQSAVSHTIRSLETRLGLRLITRTTRSLSLTQAGERLLTSIGPKLDEIDAELASLTALRDKPAGLVRINVGEHAAQTILWPALRKMLPLYPDIRVELDIDNALADIVAGRFDAGVRLGENLDRDMVAVRIAPDLRMAVVGSPSYFAHHPHPRTPQDLTHHDCINFRLPTLGNLYAWEFERDGRQLKVKVEGRLTFNTLSPVLDAVLDGFGLGYLTQDMVQPHMETGRLVSVLNDWCQPFSGYHLYYPSRRQPTPAFQVVVDALRYR